LDDLVNELSWIGECVNKIDVTNVGQQHDLIELLKPAGIELVDIEIVDK